MQHRKDIDGLRGIAVLAVIFAHAKIAGFAGGFVGVDIFFVISGFLITTSTISAINDGSFSLLNFWERRIRRIIPAFYLTLLLCLPFAWWLMHYIDRFDLIQSMLYSLSFLSNLFFEQRVDYFDGVSSLHPLIHTWSLAIEEQYYIAFPLLMLGLFSLSRKLKCSYFAVCLGGLAVIAISSLIWSEYELRTMPTKAYYLLQYRAFELLIGAITAIFSLAYSRFIPTHRVSKELLSLSGLMLIIYAVATFDYATPFPGLHALIPTIGTALILLNIHGGGLIYNILSISILRFVGKISYSAYLLHQPIIAFTWHFLPHAPKQPDYIMAIIATLVLATLSWRYVEQPFRNANRFSRNQIFSFSIIGAVFFSAIGGLGVVSHGTYFVASSQQENYMVETFLAKTRINYGLHEDCETSFTMSKNCATSNDDPEVLL